MKNTLIFLDLETSGLNPYNCVILEIYAKVMSKDQLIANALSLGDECMEFTEEFHSLISYSWLRLLHNEDELTGTAWEMHRKSGLLDELRNATQSISNALKELKELFDRYPGAVLVGRNVGTFDRVFLECKCPGICEKLSHTNYDISTLRDFSTLLETDAALGKAAHRARDDVHLDINFLCELIFELSPWICE